MSTTIVKLFWSGRSQAIRLPKAFRFDSTQVRIRQHGAAVIIEPIPDNWSWLDDLNKPDQDFIAEATKQPAPQHRDELDTLFK
ncbi:antitoxin [Castellaniella sp.]|uniref:antitoxin n=1 Tax=Castellaniella sp. TaxID=1955812 RepID=UPI003C71D792